MSDAASIELEDLLVEIGAGDRNAFAELYRRTAPKLFAVALRILGERGKAEDAMHDAYVRIWRSAASFDAARGRPMTWLATIARNIAIDMRRAMASRPAGSADALETLTAGGASSEELAALRTCLDRLDPEQRRWVVAAYLDGESREEIAARADRPVGTIKTWLHRALARLKACLGG